MGYYSGDPGFFSLLKKAGSFAASFIPGVGGVTSKIISKIPTPVRAGAMRAGTIIAKHPVLSSAGAAGGNARACPEAAGRGGARPGRGGMQINRRNSPGGRNPHTPGANPKARRRGARRGQQLVKLAK